MTSLIDYRKLLFFCALLAAVALALLRLLQDSIGPNATDVSFQERYAASLFLPEGWGFFTRSPRETKYVLYHASAQGQPAGLVTYRNSSAQNLFGFSRRSRRLNMEFCRFLPAIADGSWHKPGVQPAVAGYATVAYSARHYLLLQPGTYIVKKFEPTPWAWLKFPGHFASTERYATIVLK